MSEVTWMKKVTNEKMRRGSSVKEKMSDRVYGTILKCSGHVGRKEEERLNRTVFDSEVECEIGKSRLLLW